MSNALKAVLREAADLSSRQRYLVDLARQLDAPLKQGEAIAIPSFASLTVAADGASPGAAQSVTTNELTLTASRHPAILAKMPALSLAQLMEGEWANALVSDALRQLKASMDNTFADDLRVVAGAAASYHANLANAVVSADHVLGLIGQMRSNDGGGKLAFFVSPYGFGSLQRVAGFMPSNYAQSGQTQYGVPEIGSLFGIPVYVSNAIRAPQAVASSSNITSNECTFTVPSGHGFVEGQLITTSGFTTNLSSATAISSVTATTIVAPVTAGDGSNGTGTIASFTTPNMLVDLDVGAYVAQQKVPGFRIVEDAASTGDVLQASSIWGAAGRAGRILCLHSQAGSIKTS